MKTFDYLSAPASKLSAECRALVKRVRESKGILATLERLHPDRLQALEERAFFDSVDASARLEGICLSSERVRALIDGDAAQTEQERQIASYAQALRAVESGGELAEESPEARDASESGLSKFPFAPHVQDSAAEEKTQLDEALSASKEPSPANSLPATRGIAPGELLGLHARLFAHRPYDGRSRYRRRDTMRMMIDGRVQPVKVSPIAAFETPLYTGSACDSLTEALGADAETLLAIPCFCVDLTCIRPFDEGTGRIVRLASQLLLLRCGHTIGRYVSIDRIMEQAGTAYYDALNACASGWERNTGAYEPYIMFWLEAVQAAYQQLFEQTGLAETPGNNPATPAQSKADRVRQFALAQPGPFTKKDVVAACEGVGLSTIESALGQLVREGALQKKGGGRGTAYEKQKNQNAL